MQTLKFLALPVIALSLWFGAAAFTLAKLGELGRSTAQLQARTAEQPPAFVTASR